MFLFHFFFSCSRSLDESVRCDEPYLQRDSHFLNDVFAYNSVVFYINNFFIIGIFSRFNLEFMLFLNLDLSKNTFQSLGKVWIRICVHWIDCLSIYTYVHYRWLFYIHIFFFIFFALLTCSFLGLCIICCILPL